MSGTNISEPALLSGGDRVGAGRRPPPLPHRSPTGQRHHLRPARSPPHQLHQLLHRPSRDGADPGELREVRGDEHRPDRSFPRRRRGGDAARGLSRPSGTCRRSPIATPMPTPCSTSSTSAGPRSSSLHHWRRPRIRSPPIAPARPTIPMLLSSQAGPAGAKARSPSVTSRRRRRRVAPPRCRTPRRCRRGPRRSRLRPRSVRRCDGAGLAGRRRPETSPSGAALSPGAVTGRPSVVDCPR